MMNDTSVTEILCESGEQERSIVQYLSDGLKLDLLTDPQLKQLNYEISKKKCIFSLKSLDSETDISEFNSCSTIKSAQLKMKKSPLLARRLSTITLDS